MCVGRGMHALVHMEARRQLCGVYYLLHLYISYDDKSSHWVGMASVFIRSDTLLTHDSFIMHP